MQCKKCGYEIDFDDFDFEELSDIEINVTCNSCGAYHYQFIKEEDFIVAGEDE